jgi:hypothetical protein
MSEQEHAGPAAPASTPERRFPTSRAPRGVRTGPGGGCRRAVRTGTAGGGRGGRERPDPRLVPGRCGGIPGGTATTPRRAPSGRARCARAAGPRRGVEIGFTRKSDGYLRPARSGSNVTRAETGAGR